MNRLLRIDSSPRVEESHSRELAADVERRWRAANPAGEVVLRDLTATPVPHLDQTTLSAFLDPDYRDKPALAALAAFSDELIAELKSADEVIVSAPMYNFTVPSVLKAWIDHIVRFGLTFEVTDVTRVGVENTAVTPEALKVSRDAATTKLRELFGEG